MTIKRITKVINNLVIQYRYSSSDLEAQVIIHAMCILFIYTNPSPLKEGYRLIIASNRDEYYERPAKDAFFCPKDNLIGGRDLQQGKEGGMWLGVSLNKTDSYKLRFGCILNVTGENRKSEVEGRGFIIPKYLRSEMGAFEYIQNLQSKVDEYNAFNFVAVEIGDNNSITVHQSNSPVTSSTYIGKQIIGFGNSTTAVPLVKVTDGIDIFKGIVELYSKSEKKEHLLKELIKLLKLEDRHLPDPELQRRTHDYEYVSCIFVKVLHAGYGTRAHSILLVDYDWNVDFMEETLEEPIDINIPKWKTFKYKTRV